MNWKMMDLAARQLNADALNQWKDAFLSMSIWMQAILVGVLVLLIGASVLSCWWGFRMNRSARFLAGAASVFFIVMILLTTEYPQENWKALLIAAAAGVGGGFLYAFLERAFQFVAGFVFGSAFAAWFLPKVMHLEPVSGKGRIWALVIALAAGALFALLARKLKIVLTALEGGFVLGLLAGAFLPVGDTPWIREKLSEAQIQNLLPLVIAATGLLVQLIQFLAIRREQKSLQIPAGEERENDGRSQEQENAPGDGADETGGNPDESQEDAISIAQAEEVLVEKAKELALAAARSTQQARVKERCEDVSQGLYSVETAADRLGMTQEAFLQEMKRAGYAVPAQSDAEQQGTDPDAASKQEDATPESGSEDPSGTTSEDGKAPEDGDVSEGEEAPEEGKTDGTKPGSGEVPEDENAAEHESGEAENARPDAGVPETPGSNADNSPAKEG